MVARNRFLCLLLPSLLAWPAKLDAQMKDAVTFRHYLTPASPASPDGQITLYIEARIAPGFHMYSARQTEEMSYLNATFDLDSASSRQISLAGPLDDRGKKEVAYDSIFNGMVAQYHNQVTYIQKIKLRGESPQLTGVLRYMVCDESTCIPGSYEVVLSIPVEKKKGDESSPDPLKPDSAAAALLPPLISELDSAAVAPALASPGAPEAASAAPSPRRSLGSLMLTGFLLGLVSIFTPCLFPMIPLTVSFFVKQSTSRRKGILNALIYGLSIVVIYTGLALLLSLLFGATTVQNVANHPIFNLFYFALLFIFALSFLGMFEITLPSSWSTAAGKYSDRGGMAGIFFMALTLAVVSFSCTGPIVGWALVEASGGSLFAPAMTMLAFSAALALPFVLLAIFPGLLRSVPRSGGWLNTVKVSLGFIELAFAFIYLSRADLVEHWGLLSRELFLGIWIVIFAAWGLYLLGKITLPHDDKLEKLSVPRLLLAMGVWSFVFYLIPGLWGVPLRTLGGFLPPSEQAQATLVSASRPAAEVQAVCDLPARVHGHLSKETPAGFCAFYDLEEGLAYARTVNKPVMLDFTGHTCANCRFLEQSLWTDARIRRYLTEEYVLISLYTDDRKELPSPLFSDSGKKLRTVGDFWLNFQVETYKTNALPYYVLLGHDRQPLAEPTGYNPPLDISSYAAFFEEGLRNFRKQKGA
jgi:thiol:disulfide interchange protein DsbD